MEVESSDSESLISESIEIGFDKERFWEEGVIVVAAIGPAEELVNVEEDEQSEAEEKLGVEVEVKLGSEEGEVVVTEADMAVI